MSKLLEDVRNINEELSKYINCPSWNLPTFYYDDDDEYTIIYRKPKAITPNLPTVEPDNSLIMGDEHLNTIPETESDEIIKLVLRSFLEEVNDVDQEEEEIDLEDILQIQEVILREKLLNVHCLIANIEALNDNPPPDRVLKSPSLFPIPVEDSVSFIEKSDTSFSHLDNSLPEFETFSDDTEETRSGKVPEFESFHFDLSFPRPPLEPPDVEIFLNFEPDKPVINNFDELNEDECFNTGGGKINVSQNVKDDDSFIFVIQTFLPYRTYPVDSPLLLSTGSEDTIFDPGIST
ncbi:hypothetical protein Tco_0708692 [Tanacetum coccineum]